MLLAALWLVFLSLLSLLTYAVRYKVALKILWVMYVWVYVGLVRSKYHSCFLHLGALWVQCNCIFCELTSSLHCILSMKKITLVSTHLLWTITFICVEDWKLSPEPQHNVHLKEVVDDDADDKENYHTTKHESNGKYDVGICRDEHHTYQTYNFRLCVKKRLVRLLCFLHYCPSLAEPSDSPNTWRPWK